MQKEISNLLQLTKTASFSAHEQIKGIIRDGAIGPTLIGDISVSDGLKYHIDNNIPLTQPIYRKFSEEYFSLLKEARNLFESGLLIICADSEWMLDGNFGKFAEWHGGIVPLDFPMEISEEERIVKSAAEYKGRKVPTGKPRNIRKGEPGYGKKQYVVFVMNGDRVKRITFGDAKLRAKPSSPKARKSFKARHNCKQKTDRTSAGYWACRWPPNW